MVNVFGFVYLNIVNSLQFAFQNWEHIWEKVPIDNIMLSLFWSYVPNMK